MPASDLDAEITRLVRRVKASEHAKLRLCEIAYEIDSSHDWSMGGLPYHNQKRYDKIVAVVGQLYEPGGKRKYPKPGGG